jgi:hypothetical protein
MSNLPNTVEIGVGSSRRGQAGMPAVPGLRFAFNDPVTGLTTTLPEPGTAKRPIARFRAKLCLYWIAFDIAQSLIEMFFIADLAIVILGHPKRTFAMEQFVRLMSGEGFMCLHDRFEVCVFEAGHHRVLMIGHDTPSE